MITVSSSLEKLREVIKEALEVALGDWSSTSPFAEDIPRLVQTVINRASGEMMMSTSSEDFRETLTRIIQEVANHYQQARQPRVRVVGTGEAQNPEWWGE